MVYIADSFKTKQNAVVEDLLKKLPGIDVDKNGTITSQGQAVSKILVDGDEFFGDDPTIATKNLGAKTVESVNIYEEENEDESETADETIQVMDLRLKDGSKKGYFGKVSAASDFQNFYEGELLFNRFKNDFKLSIFALGTIHHDLISVILMPTALGLPMNLILTMEDGGKILPRIIQTVFQGLSDQVFYYSDKISKKVKLGANYTYSNNELESITDRASQYFLTDTTYFTEDLGSNYQKK